MPSVPRRLPSVAAPLAVALLLAPIVSAAVSLAAAPSANAAQHAVQIADSAFAPATVTVAAGGSVTWTNVDDRPHTVTADGGAFDSGNLDSGQSFTRTFTTPGTFTYLCAYHPEMRATVVVTASAPAAPEAGAPTGAAVRTPVPPAEAAGARPPAEAGPDTALPAPDAPPVVPALLAGLGLVSLAVAAVPGHRRASARTARTGGWRR